MKKSKDLMSHRRIDHLHRKRFVYRRFPENDIPTETYYWGYYFKEGTHEHYSMFNSKAKITTYKSLKWHIITLRYLNLTLEENKFRKIIDFILDINNGFVTFTTNEEAIENFLHQALSSDFSSAPKNFKRKIVFKDSTGLSTKEKRKIIGELSGKHKEIDRDNIYECMLYINESNKKITIAKIANILKCSSRTIYRNMGGELKKEKDVLNISI